MSHNNANIKLSDRAGVPKVRPANLYNYYFEFIKIIFRNDNLDGIFQNCANMLNKCFHYLEALIYAKNLSQL